jgi:hypothetical protein
MGSPGRLSRDGGWLPKPGRAPVRRPPVLRAPGPPAAEWGLRAAPPAPAARPPAAQAPAARAPAAGERAAPIPTGRAEELVGVMGPLAMERRTCPAARAIRRCLRRARRRPRRPRRRPAPLAEEAASTSNACAHPRGCWFAPRPRGSPRSLAARGGSRCAHAATSSGVSQPELASARGSG